MIWTVSVPSSIPVIPTLIRGRLDIDVFPIRILANILWLARLRCPRHRLPHLLVLLVTAPLLFRAHVSLLDTLLVRRVRDLVLQLAA